MSAEKKLHQMSDNAKAHGQAEYLNGVLLSMFLLGILFLSNMRNPFGEFVQVMVSWVGRLFGVDYKLVLLVGAIFSLIFFKRSGDEALSKSEKLKEY